MENPRGSNNNNNNASQMDEGANFSHEEFALMDILDKIRNQSEDVINFVEILLQEYGNLFVDKLLDHTQLFLEEELIAIFNTLVDQDYNLLLRLFHSFRHWVNLASTTAEYTARATRFWKVCMAVNFVSDFFDRKEDFIFHCITRASDDPLFLVPLCIFNDDEVMEFHEILITSAAYTYNEYTLNPRTGPFWSSRETEIVAVLASMTVNWLSIHDSIAPLLQQLRIFAKTNTGFARFYLTSVLKMLSADGREMVDQFSVPDDDLGIETVLMSKGGDANGGILHILSPQDLENITSFTVAIDDGESEEMMNALRELVALYRQMIERNVGNNNNHPIYRSFLDFMRKYNL